MLSSLNHNFYVPAAVEAEAGQIVVAVAGELLVGEHLEEVVGIVVAVETAVGELLVGEHLVEVVVGTAVVVAY